MATPVRDLGGFFEEHLLWRFSDLIRGAGEALRWPFERLAWLAERRLVWPLQERTAGRGPSLRTAGAGALATVALAAGAVGVLAISGGGNGEVGSPSRVATATSTAATQPEPEAPQGPSLEGVPPSFGSGGVAAAPGAPGTVATSPDASVSSPDSTVSGDDEAEAAAATSSSQKPVAAGPEAMKAARRFAEAFVFYEVGERPLRANTVFAETASPRLAAALAERPPRQPAGTEVPKARVLNLVPGPRSGKTYTVSASLLRVGVTSELRLKVKRLAGAWLVTDVRG